MAAIDLTVVVKFNATGAKLMLRTLVFPIKIYAWCSAIWTKFRGKTPVRITIHITTD